MSFMSDPASKAEFLIDLKSTLVEFDRLLDIPGVPGVLRREYQLSHVLHEFLYTYSPD